MLRGRQGSHRHRCPSSTDSSPARGDDRFTESEADADPGALPVPEEMV